MSEDQALPAEEPTSGVADDHAADDVAPPVEAPEPPSTGDAEVDSVISDVAGVDERPLEEHPAAFEDAHERLRGALDDPAGGEQPE